MLVIELSKLVYLSFIRCQNIILSSIHFLHPIYQLFLIQMGTNLFGYLIQMIPMQLIQSSKQSFNCFTCHLGLKACLMWLNQVELLEEVKYFLNQLHNGYHHMRKWEQVRICCLNWIHKLMDNFILNQLYSETSYRRNILSCFILWTEL